jgi:hypothetical protein
VLCHGQGSTIIFSIIWYISLYLDRLLVTLIEGELLWGDSGITVAGFDVIPPQALNNLSTPCCSHIDYVLRRYIEINVVIESAFNESLHTRELVDIDVHKWHPLMTALMVSINSNH